MTKIIQAVSIYSKTIKDNKSLIPFECKVNFNQFLQSYISHILQKFHRKIFIAVCVEKKYL